MKRVLRGLIAAAALLMAVSVLNGVSAQKRGGVLRMYTPDSPASTCP